MYADLARYNDTRIYPRIKRGWMEGEDPYETTAPITGRQISNQNGADLYLSGTDPLRHLVAVRRDHHAEKRPENRGGAHGADGAPGADFHGYLWQHRIMQNMPKCDILSSWISK